MTTNNNDNSNIQLHKFTKSLPKIELHAHLNGSIRQHTLVELASQRNVSLPPKMMLHDDDATNIQHHNNNDNTYGNEEVLFWNTHPRNLQDCFEVFEYIPKCVNDLIALRRITEEVLMDAAEDGVVYIELRTGPKCLLQRHHQHHCNSDDDDDDGSDGEIVATKREYVETIVEIMSEFERKEHLRYDRECQAQNDDAMAMMQQRKIVRLPLIPRLIISVDRAGSIEQADENINLAIELFQTQQALPPGQKKLGGNPTKNDFTIFEASFERARRAGLKVAIHIGEVPMKSNDARYNEALAVINFRPDRLGHALTLSTSLIELLEKNPIPIECCPTSNTMTLDFALHHEGSLIDGIQMHPHLKKWIECNYPISINTDDSGIFCTTLTKEYLLIAKVFEFDEKKLEEIVLDSLDHAFDDDIKARLREDIQSVVELIVARNT
ncbi:hypothetical protein ACHAWT_000460 [Skeletonema menzelii]